MIKDILHSSAHSSKVLMLGHLTSQDELPGLYRGHDVFLFTSRYEAWGMPVLEAMASGVAVVATRCLGVQTFAIHGVNALLAGPQVRSYQCSCQASSS